MATMLNVYDRQTRKKTAVLQNAFDIGETHELNKIYMLSFTLPSTDEKNKYCLPRHFVRWGDDGELYRIKSPKTDEGNVGTITYECEHVITTLCDSVMFGSFNTAQYVPNLTTRTTIEWLLSKQKQQDWVLDVCEFDRKFEYLWEQENILNALYSIPKEFATPYKWSFDTTSYPWKISLRAINTTVKPEFYLRARSNILSSGTAADYANICTRIYPLGYGEGVNQLNIKDVNNGIPYIQSPQSIVNQYGIVEKVLVDRRFENAESLKAYAQSMLDIYQTPTMSRTFDVTDLFPLTNYDWNNAEVGKICKMVQDGTIAYITKCKWQRDKAGDLQIDLSTKATDIASNVADLADRIRIESVYAQGATQLYQHSKDANATPTKGMIMSLYFPSEMRQINKVLLRLKLNRFRSYSQTTDAGGASTQTSSSGGASKQTSSSGGASTQTSSAGGASTVTSQAGGASTVTSQAGGASTVTSQAGGEATVTSQAGGQSGTTSTADSGSEISLSALVAETTDLSWAYKASPYTDNAEPGIVCNGAGSHQHYVSANTDSATPTTQNLTHNHATKLYTQADGYHSHDIEGSEHNHTIPRTNLKHDHGITLTVTNGYSEKSGFSHSHSFSISNHSHSVTLPSHTHNVSIPNHTHNVSIPSHTHSVSISNHTHTVSIPSHTHTVDIPNHTHSVSIPSHTHNISAGIFESGNPTAFDIYIGSTKKATVNATSYDGDITQWLLNNKNLVPRDTWIDVEIRPNDLAYVVSSVFIQGFVQSRGGGNY